MPRANGMKVCSKCRKTKLITEFHLLNGPAEEGREPRRRSDCKECHAKTMRDYRLARVKKEGEAYLEHERKRVRDYSKANLQADSRRAVERARHAALRELKRRHPGEYRELELEFRRQEGVNPLSDPALVAE